MGARRAALLGALAIAGAALLAYLIAPGPSGPSSSPTADPAAPSAGATPGYPRTRAGVALAAARYQQAFAGAEILEPGALAARIEELATPEFAPQMLAANQPGAARLAAGPIGAGIRAGIQTTFFAVPVAHRLISYTPESAEVALWGFTVIGNSTSAEPVAYFGTARTRLAWIEGRWRIAWTSGAFGPTPELASPRRSGEGFELGELLEEMDLYAIAR